MKRKFVWQDDFNIGVDIIDKEHQRLFKIINKLFTLLEEDKDSQRICQEGIKFFKGHAVKHFAEEEAYMASINYEGLEQHRLIHKGFQTNTLPTLEQELERTGYTPEAVEHFLGVCAGWLVGHMLTEDLAITGRGVRKWRNLLRGDEQEAMRKVIVQLMFDMFKLESQLISDTYNGEKFGKGVYYRLVYNTREADKLKEVFLVFEEKLLVNTVGKIMGLQSNKLDNMLIHAARYMAKQLVWRVIENFPDMGVSDLKEENLLSYDQFQRILEKETLQISLLFDTGGSGYFAYCVLAPHLLEDGVGNAINSENALTEVKEYLNQRNAQEESSGKGKILIVDDSATIRQGMKKLLEPDYEVMLVDSGVSALRSITLNRPDLVLLDYEMPVCDGRQTLEMLRSEKEFADIPVFFLTGRSDFATVQKVMALSPEGYLLKNLNSSDIKSKIDAFMQSKANN